jgi:hypothetical protein
MIVFHRPPFDRLRASGERPFAKRYPTRAILSENGHNIDVFSALMWEIQGVENIVDLQPGTGLSGKNEPDRIRRLEFKIPENVKYQCESEFVLFRFMTLEFTLRIFRLSLYFGNAE